MGREARCSARIDGKGDEGKILLETDELVFRGARRLRIALSAITSIVAKRGWLEVVHLGGEAAFELGAQAESWCARAKSPPSRADKLGLAPGVSVAFVGAVDPAFEAECLARGVVCVARGVADVVFLSLGAPADLARIAKVVPRLGEAGALWVVRPRGVPAIGEAVVRAAARSAGLVDVKVARFSETHTAEKFVVPRASRAKPRARPSNARSSS